MFKINFFIAVIFLSLNARSETSYLMGCSWKIPDSLLKKSEGLWASEMNENHIFSYINYKDEFFQQDEIEFASEDHGLGRRIHKIIVGKSYELVIYRDFMRSNSLVSYPGITVIKNTKGKGVWYINNLDEEKIIHMIGECMPEVKIEDFK